MPIAVAVVAARRAVVRPWLVPAATAVPSGVVATATVAAGVVPARLAVVGGPLLAVVGGPLLAVVGGVVRRSVPVRGRTRRWAVAGLSVAGTGRRLGAVTRRTVVARGD